MKARDPAARPRPLLRRTRGGEDLPVDRGGRFGPLLERAAAGAAGEGRRGHHRGGDRRPPDRAEAARSEAVEGAARGAEAERRGAPRRGRGGALGGRGPVDPRADRGGVAARVPARRARRSPGSRPSSRRSAGLLEINGLPVIGRNVIVVRPITPDRRDHRRPLRAREGPRAAARARDRRGAERARGSRAPRLVRFGAAERAPVARRAPLRAGMPEPPTSFALRAPPGAKAISGPPGDTYIHECMYPRALQGDPFPRPEQVARRGARFARPKRGGRVRPPRHLEAHSAAGRHRGSGQGTWPARSVSRAGDPQPRPRCSPPAARMLPDCFSSSPSSVRRALGDPVDDLLLLGGGERAELRHRTSKARLRGLWST